MIRRDRIGLVLLVVILTACATPAPRWTPQTVALPATPPEGVQVPEPLDKRVEPVVVAPPAEHAQPVKLTRDGALLTALRNNRSIDVARLGPQIGETFVPEAKAAFDPALLGTISTGHTTRSVSGGLTSNSTTTNNLSTLAAQAANAAGAPPIPSSLSTLSTLAATLQSSNPPSLATTDTSQGSLTIQEVLPTGTQLFLTGEATSTDTSGTGDQYQGDWTLGVTQSLLRGAGTSVNLVALRQAKNTAAKSQHAFRGAVLDVTQQVELAYWNFVLVVELRKIREFAVNLADEQLKRNESLLQVGKAIEGDVMAAQAEKATRTADLTDAQAGIRSQTLQLIRLMNPGDTRQWQLSFEPADAAEVVKVPVSADTSKDLALQYRPELAQAKLDVANSDLGVTQAKNGLLPRLDLVGTYGRVSEGASSNGIANSLDDPHHDNYSIGLQFQKPILNRAEHARYKRALLQETQAGRTLGDLESQVETGVRQAVVEVERQLQRIDATQEALKSRAEQLRVAGGRFEVGKTTNLDLLLVQRDYIQAQVDDITACVNYIEALTSLYASEGTLLERRGIRLDTGNE